MNTWLIRQLILGTQRDYVHGKLLEKEDSRAGNGHLLNFPGNAKMVRKTWCFVRPLCDLQSEACQVGLRAQVNFSAPTLEPAHEARTEQSVAFSVQSASAAMQPLDHLSASELSRNELSAKRAGKNVIDFCRADRSLLSKSLASYFQTKNRKYKVV